jgi:predicted TIM-barrel fold metal-dependent hydrolase
MTWSAIDAAVHHDWATQEEIVEYLPSGWRQFVEESSTIPFRDTQLRLLDEELPIRPVFHPLLPEAANAVAPAARGVTDPAQLSSRASTASILAYGAAAHVPMHGHTDLGVAVCAAMNDWTADRWLTSAHPGLFGSILVPTQLPDAAVAEIRRHGSNTRMAQVLITANGLGKPLGHPLYHPIYRAAAEFELPVSVLIGSDAAAHTTTHQVAVAPPATYSEYRILAVQAFMTHVMSLVGQGVFEEFPRLRMLLIGGGVSWLPPAMWRDDACYKAFGVTAPWVRRAPSEYIAEHIHLATYQLEAPAAVAAAAAAFPALEQMLCLASGYPRADAQSLDATLRALPAGWSHTALRDNARRLFGGRITVRDAITA